MISKLAGPNQWETVGDFEAALFQIGRESGSQKGPKANGEEPRGGLADPE
jgi:hypothetical protein